MPSTVLFDVSIAAILAGFLLLAAIDHLVLAGPLRRWYEKNLGARSNYARWIEHSVSASIMIVLIAMFTGIRDIAALHSASLLARGGVDVT